MIRIVGALVAFATLASCNPPRGEVRASDAPAATEARAAHAPSGKPSAPEPPSDEEHDGPRIGSLRHRTWIWPEPNRTKDRLAIGSVRVGTSVRLASAEPVPGRGCNAKWFAVLPHGYVCADETTTRDFTSPYWRALATLRPKPGPWPYRYAFSMGAPMYSRVPTKAEQGSAERELGPRGVFRSLGKWSEGHEQLVSTDEEHAFRPEGDPPAFFSGHEPIDGSPWNPAQPNVKVIPAGSGFAYARVFEAAGRIWLLTPDLFLVPADRVFPYVRSAFKGTELGKDRGLPVAWVRSPDGAPKLVRSGDGARATGERFPARAPVFLTGDKFAKDKITYWEAKGGGYIADDDDVTVVEKPKALKHGIRKDERWIEASILGGTMTAFVGLDAVYTTLWSPGKGGVPVKGNDPKKFATTEIGVFPIQWKDAVETMSPDPGAPTVFWFADVPWIQYVHAPMALHVSFWHERFGYPMSAECLNVSAEDGRWLFDFTLPKVPEGWGGAGAGRQNGPSTKINITP